MSTLASVIIRDVIASRPAAGIEGRLFFASDTGANYYDDGANWQSIGGSLTVTTKGDLQGFSTVPARVAVGTDGDVLTADSGAAEGVSWQPGGGGGGPLGTAIFDASGGSIASLVVGGIVSGVTYNGVGDYTLTFSSATNLIFLASAQINGSNGVGYLFMRSAPTSTTARIGMLSSNLGEVPFNSPLVMVAIFQG